MVDPKDVTDEARAKMKRHLASMMAESDRLGALVSKDEAELTRLDAELAVLSGGSEGALHAELSALRGELAARLTANREAHALVQQNFEATAAEMKDLAAFGERMQREDLVARASPGATPGDPLSSDVTDRALANVRDHIGALSEQAALGDDLRQDRGAPDPTADEAKVRAQLEALKAARKKGSGGRQL